MGSGDNRFTLVVAIRIRLLGIPLERDEGEYAYAGQLILQGVPPYKLVVRQSVNSRRFIATTKSHLFVGKRSEISGDYEELHPDL